MPKHIEDGNNWVIDLSGDVWRVTHRGVDWARHSHTVNVCPGFIMVHILPHGSESNPPSVNWRIHRGESGELVFEDSYGPDPGFVDFIWNGEDGGVTLVFEGEAEVIPFGGGE